MKIGKSMRGLTQQAGLAILDILVWAGGIILAIALIGGLAFLVTSSGTSINYATGLAAIKKCATDVMYGSADKSTVTNTVVLNAQCIPPAWISGTSIVTPGGTNNGFKMAVTNVSNEACTGMLPGMAPAFYQIDVDATTVKAAGSNSTVPATLATACSTSPPVNVDFYFIQ